MVETQRPTVHPLLACALLSLSLQACVSHGTPDGTADEELNALFEEVWRDALARNSYLRLREGVPIEVLDDLSFESHRELVGKADGWLERLRALDLEALDHASWIDARALAWDLEMVVEGERWFWHQSLLTPYSSPLPGVVQLLASRPLATEEQRERFLDLLAQVPELVSRLEARVRGQAERGVFVWRPNLEPSVALLRSFLADGSRGPFAVDEERLAGLDDTARGELVERSGRIVRERIDPAIEKLLAFVESEEYAVSAPTSVGALRLPDGEEYYRFRVRQATTLDVEPEEIHRRGLALVAEMEAEMAALREATGFEGSRKEFRDALRTDPQYFPETADEVARRLLEAADAMEEVLARYFVTRPEAEYGVERLEPAMEGSQTYGIYRPPTPQDPVGRYHYNGSRLDQRSWLNLRAVSLHELVPGHHFHIARQAENERLPAYRRNTWHTAYTEGWGSYSSYLGLEAGVYEGDPLSAYGMYVLEIFLATRLVVDTGMNLLGWSLEEGRDFMRRHTLESETQIRTESLRYAADMPGQALGYQMGKLLLLELRQRAERELGERFDLPTFHEAVLEHGSLPLAVLEEHVEWWIEQQ